MKRILLIASALVTLVVTGCNKERLSSPSAGETAQVTMSVSLPVDAVKSMGDGSAATELYYAVFTQGGQFVPGLAQPAGEYVPVVGKTASVTIPLVRNFTYKVIFWAQAPGAPYTFNKETGVVTVSYAGDANDESRDAFCNIIDVAVPDLPTFKLKDIPLTRPFAQINIGAADYASVKELGILVESTVTISGLSDTYDILGGTVSGNASTQLTATTVPAQRIPAEKLDVNGTDYGYVSMNYILAPVNEFDAQGNVIIDRTELANLTASFFYNGSSIDVEVPNLPYQRNFRTNVIGNIFTNNVSFEIFIDDTFFEPAISAGIPSYVAVSTPAELAAALAEAGAAGSADSVIDITSDLDMTNVVWTPINVDGYNGADVVTVKGNGNTITGLTAPLFAGGFAGGSGIVIENLTIADSPALVSTNTLGSGAFIESIDSMDKIILRNCHVLNSNITGGNGSRTGGLIGWTAGYNNQNDGAVKTYVTIENCSVIGCTITCDGSVGGLYGHAGNNAWTFSTVKDCTVKDCTLNSTDDGAWRVGVVVGTANVGEMTISGITESGNTLAQTGKTAPAGQSNLYGRFVPGTTGKLTIDGVDIN